MTPHCSVRREEEWPCVGSVPAPVQRAGAPVHGAEPGVSEQRVGDHEGRHSLVGVGLLYVSTVTGRLGIAEGYRLQVEHTNGQGNVESVDRFAARAFRGAQTADVVVADGSIEGDAVAPD